MGRSKLAVLCLEDKLTSDNRGYVRGRGVVAQWDLVPLQELQGAFGG